MRNKAGNHARIESFLLLYCCLLLTACSQSASETRLLERVDALEQAIQNKQNDTAIDILSEQFRTGRNETRKDAQRLLLFHAMRNQSISIVRSNTRAELDPLYQDQASVSFNALVTGGDGGLLPARGNSYRVESGWIFVDGDWYLERLDWQPLL